MAKAIRENIAFPKPKHSNPIETKIYDEGLGGGRSEHPNLWKQSGLGDKDKMLLMACIVCTCLHQNDTSYSFYIVLHKVCESMKMFLITIEISYLIILCYSSAFRAPILKV